MAAYINAADRWLCNDTVPTCNSTTLISLRNVSITSHNLLQPAAYPLSEDHKPNRTDERQRIESAGGVVVWAGTWRVGGVLAVSRAFGKGMFARHSAAVQQGISTHTSTAGAPSCLPKCHGIAVYLLLPAWPKLQQKWLAACDANDTDTFLKVMLAQAVLCQKT